MFKNEYQGGPFVEIFSSQGKDPVAKWKLCGSPAVQKVFDKEVKSYVYILEGSSQRNKMQLPKDSKQTLGLIQRFLVLQLCVPVGQDFSTELLITDLGNIKRRLYLSTIHKELSATPLHAKIPLSIIKRKIWSNICIDMVSFANAAFKGAGFQSLDRIVVSANCKLRKIFTMKLQPQDTTFENDVYSLHCFTDGPTDVIPKSCQLGIEVDQVTQLLNVAKLRQGELRFGSQPLTSTDLDQQTNHGTASARTARNQNISHIAFGSKVLGPPPTSGRKHGTTGSKDGVPCGKNSPQKEKERAFELRKLELKSGYQLQLTEAKVKIGSGDERMIKHQEQPLVQSVTFIFGRKSRSRKLLVNLIVQQLIRPSSNTDHCRDYKQSPMKKPLLDNEEMLDRNLCMAQGLRHIDLLVFDKNIADSWERIEKVCSIYCSSALSDIKKDGWHFPDHLANSLQYISSQHSTPYSEDFRNNSHLQLNESKTENESSSASLSEDDEKDDELKLKDIFTYSSQPRSAPHGKVQSTSSKGFTRTVDMKDHGKQENAVKRGAQLEDDFHGNYSSEEEYNWLNYQPKDMSESDEARMLASLRRQQLEEMEDDGKTNHLNAVQLGYCVYGDDSMSTSSDDTSIWSTQHTGPVSLTEWLNLFKCVFTVGFAVVHVVSIQNIYHIS
ncbi:protein CFAP20DC [Mustelus asterias]